VERLEQPRKRSGSLSIGNALRSVRHDDRL
jgi:hypothetical protein